MSVEKVLLHQSLLPAVQIPLHLMTCSISTNAPRISKYNNSFSFQNYDIQLLSLELTVVRLRVKCPV